MSLIDKFEEFAIALPYFVAKRVINLTLEEQVLKLALDKAHSHVAGKWDADLSDNTYREIMSVINEHLKKYDGRFNDYFHKSLRNIENWVYDIAGYH